MTEPSQDAKVLALARIGSQPIAYAAAALIVIVAGIGAIVLWRTTSGTSPEQERIVSARQVQVRLAQASEQAAARTKDLELSQQQSIDQLQLVQDHLQSMHQLISAQRTETKRLSEQVAGLTESLDSLRQSFASNQSPEASAPSVRKRPTARYSSGKKARRSAFLRKRGKSRS